MLIVPEKGIHTCSVIQHAAFGTLFVASDETSIICGQMRISKFIIRLSRKQNGLLLTPLAGWMDIYFLLSKCTWGHADFYFTVGQIVLVDYFLIKVQHFKQEFKLKNAFYTLTDFNNVCETLFYIDQVM